MEQKQNKKASICFKRWKRTPWAAFASMGKTIKIGVLCVTYSLLVLKSQPLLAQSQTKTGNETIRALEELVISTERPTPFQPLVRVIAVIQAPEIERAAVQNLQDLLRYIQGVDLRSRGSEGVQADINILGGTFDQTMVMINGINFSDPQTGHHSLNIPLELSQIERIEVLHGQGAWSNGSIAYSGAINIITKNPTKKGLDLFISGGNFGYLKAAANIKFANNTKDKYHISGQIGGGYTKSDGYSANTDFEIGNLFAGISISSKTGHSLTFQAGNQNKSFGANSFYSTKYPNQYERIRTFLSSVQYQYQKGNWQFISTIYQRRLFDRFELFRDNPQSWYNGHNYHQNNVFGIGMQIAKKWEKIGTTILGVDWRNEHIYSNVLGDVMGNTKPVPFEDDKFFTKSKERNIPSVFIKHLIQYEKWRFTAGAMINNTFNGPVGRDSYGTKLNAGLSASYQINPYIEANMWVNSSSRNPTFTDLYYKSPTQTGNVNLKPEEAISSQLGIRYTTKKLRSSLSAFYRHGYRIIDWVRISNNDQWQSSNITDVSSAGIETNATYYWNKCWINYVGFSYTYMSVIKSSNDYHSLYATDYLKNKARIFIDHKIVSKLSAGWNFTFQDRTGTYLNRENAEIAYKPFALVDLKVKWTSAKYTLFVEATNLANTKYFDLGNLDQPGRWIKSGLTINL